MNKTKTTDFTLAVLDGALASSVAITLDALTAASRLSAIRGGPALCWRIIGTAVHTQLSSGLSIGAAPLTARTRGDDSILLIPGVAITANPGATYDPVTLATRMAERDATLLTQFVAKHHQRGGVVAAGCSAVYLLGQAGLLEQRSATTHWRLGSFMQQSFPACVIDTNRIMIEDNRVITAGAALAQMDLMIYLIRKKLGAQIAELTMKYLLLDNRFSQAGYMIWSHLPAVDSTIQDIESMVEASLPEVPSLRTIAERLAVSEKTLARRVRQATGKSSQDLLQSIRWRHAKRLLETTRLSLEDVAAQVGYADATALRKLTRKIVGTSPGRLRHSAW